MTLMEEIESLHPANFTMVMSTGIISLGANFLGWFLAAELFGFIAIMAWLVLMGLCLIRIARYPGAIKIDLTNPRMVFSYFSLVAATNIIGLLAFSSHYIHFAMVCWLVAFIAWCLLLYMAFSVLTFLSHENNVNIMHGGWLITIVGTQSLVLLGVQIAPELGEYAGYMMVEVHLLWGLGLALYGIFVTLFCYRIFFLALKPHDLSPLLWVVMGASAISANAGTLLIDAPDTLPFLLAQKPFIDGITLMIWGWATWWIPLLFLFGVWKHGVNKIPFHYDPILWSMVFPLGMYAVASARLGKVIGFPPMLWISYVMMLLALVVWCCVFFGQFRKVYNLVTPQKRT